MIKAEIRSRRKPGTSPLTAFTITWAAILFVGGNNGLAQQNQNNPARASPANVEFVTGHSALNIPFDFEFNQIVLRVRVNNATSLKFMFDTGAGISLMSARRAAELKLKQVDTVKATGVGGSVEGSLANGVSLSVPGVTVLNQRLALLPMDVPFCEGKDIAGIIGYDFIKEFVVEINYQTRTLSLFAPSNYKYKGHGELFPLIMKGTPRGAQRSLTLRHDGKVRVVAIKLQRRI